MARTSAPVRALPDLSTSGDAVLAPALLARHEHDVHCAAATLLGKYQRVLEGVGRIRAMQFAATVSDAMIAQTFNEIRRDKLYRGLPVATPDGGVRTIETMEEFCAEFLGRSYERCRQLADNLHVLGPRLYEEAQAIGFKTRDYRALQALPADDQAAVKEALEGEDKDTALSVLSALVARHQDARAVAERQRDEAQSARAETQANYEAATAIIGERETLIRQLRGGEVPPPGIDERLAGWAPRAATLLEEMGERLLSLAEIVAQASQLESDGDDDEALLKALTAIDNVVSGGLSRHLELASSLLVAAERGLTDRIYGPSAVEDPEA